MAFIESKGLPAQSKAAAVVKAWMQRSERKRHRVKGLAGAAKRRSKAAL
jgi:hypothetical protein